MVRKVATKKCPVCGKPPDAERAPFCSVRCADADLARWLRGEYKIPTNEKPEEDKTAGDED